MPPIPQLNPSASLTVQKTITKRKVVTLSPCASFTCDKLVIKEYRQIVGITLTLYSLGMIKPFYYYNSALACKLKHTYNEKILL